MIKWILIGGIVYFVIGIFVFSLCAAAKRGDEMAREAREREAEEWWH